MTQVLVINCGSSSVKYEVLDPNTGERAADGIVERLGTAEATITHHTAASDETYRATNKIADHSAALSQIFDLMATRGPDLSQVGVVAHRVVNGAQFSNATVIDHAVLEAIEAAIPLAPLHNPANLAGIRVARDLLGSLPHVAVFDTAFFAALPEAATTYAIDQKLAHQLGIRRYGYHGTSHSYVARATRDVVSPRPDATFRQIVLHLGNGASASAIVDGQPIATSMGLTPLEGLVMGTRCGDIDPGAVLHMLRAGGLSADDVDQVLNRQSGMLGLCGHGDLRDVYDAAEKGDTSATLALEVYVDRLISYVGSYAALMGGLNAVTFTAGVGENASWVRERVCARLGFLGIELDPATNNSRSTRGARRISTPDSPVTVLVVPTDEELEIARQAVTVAAP